MHCLPDHCEPAQARVQPAWKKAGVPHFRPHHDTRHERTSNLFEAKWSMVQVTAQTGQQTPNPRSAILISPAITRVRTCQAALAQSGQKGSLRTIKARLPPLGT